ncbi:hypothetical protein [Sphingomonas xinjiangensis]|uniref:Uncharacterized protein n=1 Tax=Sphingomonas xinjiangensis TaxID=643568 RepID=A0A840YJX2_9SPHN|nr:hypothetical protein [Sphingomonas xinjiangensis]MBB5711358.1 hypothetical protein [Sphingomonas xinjiangensis]
MRLILVLLGLAALVVVGLLATGMISLDAYGGRLPTISAETGKVAVGSSNRTVEVPTVEMRNTTVSLPTIEVQQAPPATTAPTPVPAQ